MKKIMTKVVLKELSLRQKAKEILQDTSGGGSDLTDNAGFIIIGLVLIGVILAAAQTFTSGTFLPALWAKIMALFD
jgi:hypothetical protein